MFLCNRTEYVDKVSFDQRMITLEPVQKCSLAADVSYKVVEASNGGGSNVLANQPGVNIVGC